MRATRGRFGRWLPRAAAAGSALLLASCLSSGGGGATGLSAAPMERDLDLSAERLERLDAAMKAYVADGGLAGAVVMIHEDGREVFSEAYGWRDREASAPMREDTIFRIASQTKALTSVAILMLMEEGRLTLSDPLGKHLPEWSRTTVAVAKPGGGYDVVPAKRAITLRDLLTHTAGVSYGTGPGEAAWKEAGVYSWYFADKREPVADVVRRMASLPMAAQPGEQFVYGYGTDILGVVVETISGQTLDAFLRQRLIEPLGMVDTHFCLPPEKAPRLAVVYSARAGGLERAGEPGALEGWQHVGQGHYLNGPCVAFAGGAGLVSTAADYSRFLEMLRRDGELDGRRYLSPKSVELMRSNHIASTLNQTGAGPFFGGGQGFGLGFRITTDVGASGQPGSKGDYGWGGAYHSTYWVDPEQEITVAYMTQLIPAGGLDDHAKLRALIHSALE